MEPIISLIFPAYNVEKYIETCIHSCEQQDLPKDNYELIIVNDGSSDGTLNVIKRLQNLYGNIEIVNQINMGVSMARNNGFEKARGKYIWFIDPDDTIVTNCLSTLIDIIEKLNLDALTVGPSIPFRDTFPQPFSVKDNISEVYNGVDYILCTGRFVVGPWSYIFKRDFWDENRFQFYPGIFYEDTQLMAYVISKVLRIAAFTKFSCYNYIQRGGSTMHSLPTKQKILSEAVIVNTHLQYSKETKNEELSRLFRGSASAAFIGGVKKIIQMNGDKDLINEFLSVITCRPTYIYGSGIVKRLYQYFILNFPRTFIRIAKLKK